MKIGIEAQRLFRSHKHGMDIVVLELIRNLMKTDKLNQYFIFVAPGPDKCLSETDNFKIVEIKSRIYPYWEQILLPLAASKYGCEILHCTSNTAPVFSKRILVTTIHDIIYLEPGWLFNKNISAYQRYGNLYRKLVVPAVFRKSKKVITVSEFEKGTINMHFGLPTGNDKVKVIYNGVSEHFRKVTNKEEILRIRQKYNLPEDFIFHLGNRTPKKNTSGVLKAYVKYLTIAEEKLPLVITDLSIREVMEMMSPEDRDKAVNNIIATGYVSNIDLPAIYSSARLFLYPSLRESFGIPVLEALKCGVPVITSDTSSLPEISGNAALFVNPFNPDDITSAIIKITSNKQLGDNMMIKGPLQAEKFSWSKMASEVAAVYRNIYKDIQTRA